MAEYLTVTALNHMAKLVLEQSEPLANLVVCGEISSFVRHYKSGHCYFVLKDGNSSVKTVMFRDKARLLNFEPQNGMLVLAYGHATLYERDGAFQFYVDYMRPFGAGAAQMAFDALKKKLEAEGLFAPERKKPLPAMPRCIGVVSSKTGAALQDVIQVISRRWPLTKLLLAPVSVQGQDAEASVAAGIRALDADRRTDLLLVTRGGGSKEDLWVFNSERIAHAAAACHKPLVSAVGHEIDTTILDYVADLRAPTPSAAAELCVPDRADMQERFCILRGNIQKNIQSCYQVCYNDLDVARRGLEKARRGISDVKRRQQLAQAGAALQATMRDKMRRAASEMQAGAALTASLNPYSVLARGYAMPENALGEYLEVSAMQPGQRVRIHGSSAVAHCTVERVEQIEGASNHENAEDL